MSEKKSDIFLSVVVPTVNSASIIRQTLQQLTDEIKTFSFTTEMVLVNDNSTDHTAAYLLDFALQHSEMSVKIIEHTENYGQCISTINGLKAASGKYLVVFDDDLQFDVKEINRLLLAVLENKSAKVICGYREENKSKRLFNRMLRYMAGACLFVFFPSYRDKHYFTSLKIFNRELLFDGNIFTGMNIYFFWTIKPDDIAFISVGHCSGIRGKSNYTIGNLIKGLDFLIVKFLQRIVLSVILVFGAIDVFRYIGSSSGLSAKDIMILCVLTMVYLITFRWLKMKNKQMLTRKYNMLHGYVEIR